MPKWKYKISIKDTFQDNPTPQDIKLNCDILVRQLNKIIKVPEFISFDYSDIIEEFEELSEFIAKGDIMSGLCYESYIEWFNEWLDRLYDLGDTWIDNEYKFMWIG